MNQNPHHRALLEIMAVDQENLIDVWHRLCRSQVAHDRSGGCVQSLATATGGRVMESFAG